VEVKVAVSPLKRTVAEPTGVTRTCAGSNVAESYGGSRSRVERAGERVA
jgi:hypothetical protein